MPRLSLMLLLLVFGLPAFGDEASLRLAKQLRVDPKEVSPSGVAGLYRVVLGPQVLYLTADGKYALRGDLIELASGKDLSAEDRAAARLAYIKAMGDQDMIVFAPPHPRHVLTVLTDIDCGFCRQLAGDTSRLMELGVELRYLAYPRSGVSTPSWEKAAAVWCAKDRRGAYLSAMQGKAVAAAASDCDQKAVLAGYDFAMKLGFHGTPVIITEGGQIIDGYLPPEDLLKLLDDPAALAGLGS
jgi:thiol:disulfide interchange protein DsbC